MRVSKGSLLKTEVEPVSKTSFEDFAIFETHFPLKNTAHPEARKEQGPQIFWRIITPAKSTKPRKGGNDIISTAAAAAGTSATPEGNVRTFQA